MKAYISGSFSKRALMEEVINAIIETLQQFNIGPFVFIDNYKFEPAQEKIMMQQAMSDINNCDLFIAETSYKAIGVGVEAGYAKARGKPVIYIRHAEAAHSTTVSGISDIQIVYSTSKDLQEQLANSIELLKNKNS